MKKGVIIFFLFVLPIAAYLFFASGVNNFTTLPTITPEVDELPEWESLSGEPVKLQDKITVLGFLGSNLYELENKESLKNFVQLIYNKNQTFQDFQTIMVVPIDAKAKVDELIYEFDWKRVGDITNWKFVFASHEEIQNYYNTLGLIGNLDQYSGTSNVYILDKSRNLRGRKGKNKKGTEEYKEGYSIISPAELKNEMEDDFKIILYEYRAAYKRNQPKREI
jgi:hypothetical protein